MMGAVSPAAISTLQFLHAHIAPATAAWQHGAVSCSSTLRRRKSCFLRTCVEKKASLSGITLDVKTTFLEVYEILKFELLNDPVFGWTHDSHQWVEQMMDYNMPRGKLLRGLSVIDCYKSLTQDKHPIEDELFLANVLGWCIEWLQAFSLIFDDIMDGSQTRRGQACWYRVPKVGNIAINDGAILENQVPRILKKHFREKPYYVDLLHLFAEVAYQTNLGQMMDLTTAIEGEKDILKYSWTLHHHIAQYKTSCYSFYLPVACALLLAGENLDNHENVKELLFDMGIFFQVVDDYLDCFGDPNKTGKMGTDIEDFKCSWLVLQALELCNDEQKKILLENYGKTDAVGVAKVKAIYNDLHLQRVFASYQTNKYNELRSRVETHPNKAVQVIWAIYIGCLNKLL